MQEHTQDNCACIFLIVRKYIHCGDKSWLGIVLKDKLKRKGTKAKKDITSYTNFTKA